MPKFLGYAFLVVLALGCSQEKANQRPSCLHTEEAIKRYYDTVYGQVAPQEEWRKEYGNRCWCNACGNISCEAADGKVVVALWCPSRCEDGKPQCLPMPPPKKLAAEKAVSSPIASGVGCWCEGDSAVCDEGQQEPLLRKYCQNGCSGGECD